MISYWLDVALCGLTLLLELFGAVVLAIAVQFIFIKVFKINPVLKFLRFLDRLDKKLTEMFG